MTDINLDKKEILIVADLLERASNIFSNPESDIIKLQNLLFYFFVPAHSARLLPFKLGCRPQSLSRQLEVINILLKEG